MEIWKDIKDYEGIYQVSNLGNVRSLDRLDNRGRKTKGRELKKKKMSNGYEFVQLYKYNKFKNCSIHRLVAQAFLPNPSNLPQVNHKDENITNNRVENLEWCTNKYNTNYGTRNKRLSELKNKYKQAVYSINIETKEIKEYESICDAHRQTKIDKRSIIHCCKGTRNLAGNYMWSYKK